MANQVYISIQVHLMGDGSSLTATIVLDSTPLYANSGIINYKSMPDSVQLVQIIDAAGSR